MPKSTRRKRKKREAEQLVRSENANHGIQNHAHRGAEPTVGTRGSGWRHQVQRCYTEGPQVTAKYMSLWDWTQITP